MAGIANDYLIYPILDLVRDEIRKNNLKQSTMGSEGDPFEGTPNVVLERTDPFDSEILTRVYMTYPSGYFVDILLIRGTDDWSTIPPEVDKNHPDYEYYLYWRLTKVLIRYMSSPAEEPLLTEAISLNYDDRGLLIGTTVDRI